MLSPDRYGCVKSHSHHHSQELRPASLPSRMGPLLSPSRPTVRSNLPQPGRQRRVSSRVSHTLDHIARVCIWLPALRVTRRFIRIVSPCLFSPSGTPLIITICLSMHLGIGISLFFTVLNKAAMSLQGQLFVSMSFPFFWVNT